MGKIKNWPLLLLLVLLCQGAGIIGSVFTFASIPTWYAGLEKPFFAPPNFIFGPVWTALYALMGIALYLVWVSKSKQRTAALRLFFLQLGLNTLWSILFFGLRNPGLAFVEIIAMWIAIFLTIRAFRAIERRAAYLLYPYLAWVSFAALLNLSLWLLN